MPLTRRSSPRLAGAVALCLLLASCGGGGGGGAPAGSSAPPFPTASEDQLPSGQRIDVSTRNLFPMGPGDVWNYNRLDAGGVPTGATVTHQVTAGPDASGRVSLTVTETGSAPITTQYIVNDDGLLDTAPLGDVAPATAANIVGALFEYSTPFYPQGTTRRHVRSGAWGADLDGDGVGESFRLEFTQEFLGFETLQISPAMTLTDVAHFRNVLRLTLRPTAPGNTDATIVGTEEAWLAPNLGLAKAIRSVVDGAGAVVDPLHTLSLTSATVGGANWNPASPPTVLDGQAVDIRLVHNALVYDSVRNVYYASIPGSVLGTGNSIAKIDPVTRQVTHSAPIGTEPNALALAADGSVLYVGLDGSGELLKLALPSLTVSGRAQLVSNDPGQVNAETIAVSPVDATLAAVSMMRPNVSPRHAGVALFRDMVVQPKRTQTHTGSNLVVFDSTGATLYGLNTETTEFGLRSIQVLADGLAELFTIAAATNFSTRALGFAGGRIIAGHVLYDAPALGAAGTISSASDCVPRRASSLLLCLTAPDVGGQARLLIVDSSNFVIGASVLFAFSEPSIGRPVEGPAGQVAISYPAGFSGPASKIRLFSSTQFLAPPTPPAPSWPVTMSSTADGQALDVEIVHNSLVYDSGRNVYYASIPGSVVRAGNTIASVNPATGQVTHSGPIGSEPNALAIAEDGSVLYVGLDGSGEVLRLALPSMTPMGRTRLIVDSFFGRARAEAIAVSPADGTVAAVSMAWFAGFSPRHAGAALLRDMVMQPQRTQTHTGSNLVTFDSAGTTLYGLNIETTEFGLRRIQVLADGLLQDLVVTAATGFGTRALAFANNRVISGAGLYDVPALSPAGGISGASDCWAERSGARLLCLASFGGQVLVADSSTFVIGASLVYVTNELNGPRRLVQGPAGQVAISYTSASPFFATPSMRLFSSPLLP